MREGAELGLGHVGSRAQNALRLEKSWGTWAREFRPIYGPYEAGLDRFVALDKGDFIGRDAALKEKESGGKRRLVTLVFDAAAADRIGAEPALHHGQATGRVTSAGLAPHLRNSN